MDKKSADEYDKMLDMADNLSQMFSQSSVELSDNANEELSIFLAQHREEVLVALLAKKPSKTTSKKSIEKTTDAAIVDIADSEEKKPAVKAKKSKAKVAATKLSEAS
jgi:dsDNA-binding SOS-regulon protein